MLSVTVESRGGALKSDPLTYYVMYKNGVPESRGVICGDYSEVFSINNQAGLITRSFSHRDPRSTFKDATFLNLEDKVYELFREQIGTAS